MGVFARLFRKSRAAEETRIDGTRTDAAAAGPKTAQDAAGAGEPTTSADVPKPAGPAVAEAGGDGGGIPKQQSSEAADSGAGEDART
ncbi:hypothetical protein GCM10019016_039050 [Streptomyces prasinosporus]|uniref:Gliding motility protein n=1 Tax=Streptomyces prasinosporus TaxID=68256 RepID=A0ABP6TQJ7_9ACTN